MFSLFAIEIGKILIGIVLGIVQGISEWLPISSKTQIILVSTFLLHLSFSQAYALGLFMEGGTFIAAVIYFRKELYKVIEALLGKGDIEGRRLFKYLLIVTIVTAIVAIPIYKYVLSFLSGPVIGIPMMILGVLLIADGVFIKMSKRNHAGKDITKLTNLDFVLIGISQGISALPGVSRSGTTVSAMLFMNIKPEEAFRLSFFALILASIGATGVTVLFSNVQINAVFTVFPLTYIAIAAIISIAVSLVFIDRLIKAARTGRITNIIFVLGAIAIIGGLIGVFTGLAG